MSHLSSSGKEQIGDNQTDFLKRAIEMLYGEYRPEQELEAFITHWGGTDPETFLRVLAEGQDED